MKRGSWGGVCFGFFFSFAETASVLPWVGGWGILTSSCIETFKCKDGPDLMLKLLGRGLLCISTYFIWSNSIVLVISIVLMCDTIWIHILCGANISVSPGSFKKYLSYNRDDLMPPTWSLSADVLTSKWNLVNVSGPYCRLQIVWCLTFEWIKLQVLQYSLSVKMWYSVSFCQCIIW